MFDASLRRAPVSPTTLLKYPIASVGRIASFMNWLGILDEKHTQNLKAFVSDDYALVKARPIGTDFVACGPRFVFEQELRDGTLVELRLQAEARYECWMLTTESTWRSPVVKRIAQFAKAAMRAPSRLRRFEGHAQRL
jgi:hypothetical protein